MITIYNMLMSTFTKTLATIGAGAILLPSVVFASGVGERTFEGRGRVTAEGMGVGAFEGGGKMFVKGSGTLSFSKNAEVKIRGTGIRSETDDMITYTGFNGTARIHGKNVEGSLNGDVEQFSVRGKGKVELEGDGTVHARRWKPMTGASVTEIAN